MLICAVFHTVRGLKMKCKRRAARISLQLRRAYSESKKALNISLDLLCSMEAVAYKIGVNLIRAGRHRCGKGKITAATPITQSSNCGR